MVSALLRRVLLPVLLAAIPLALLGLIRAAYVPAATPTDQLPDRDELYADLFEGRPH